MYLLYIYVNILYIYSVYIAVYRIPVIKMLLLFVDDILIRTELL